MSVSAQFVLYLSLMTLSLLIGLLRYKHCDTASGIIILLLAVTLISELTSYYFAVTYSNNMPVYHVFNPTELLIISFYFNFSIKAFRRKNIGIYIGLIGVVLGIINTVFFQPIKSLNSYFLLFEGFTVIFMSLFSYREMFEDIHVNAARNPHFWFSSIFLFISGVTYSNWALYGFVGAEMTEIVPSINFIILTVSTIAYACFGIVFFLIPKMNNSEQ